jgi:biopolymer transport protein ExbB/biopolymer transport protein TolQ
MLTQQLLKLAAVGGEWVLWVLIGLSFLSVGAVVDRWWFFRRGRFDVDALGRSVLDKLQAGDRKGALQSLEAHGSVEAAVLRRCLEWLDDGPDAMEQVLTSTLRDVRPTLDKGTVLLGTIGNNAPFVGLFGTVLGVVQAFRGLEGGAAGDMGKVMSSIAEALVATAAGIAVAIPAVIAFNYFSSRSAEVEERAQSLVGRVLALQKSTRRSGVGRAAEG